MISFTKKLHKHKTVLSIISPVYNVSSYIGSFIVSLQEQSFRDWELLAINDGSTDNSLEILERFAKNDKRIRIITKKNGGINSARNTGLDNAIGEYIAFCDPDDLIPPGAFTKLFQRLINDKLDIVIGQLFCCKDFGVSFDMEKLNKNPIIPYIYRNRVLKWQDFDFEFFYLHHWFISLAGKVYKRKLWESVRFVVNLKMADDQSTNKEIFLKSNKIGIVDDYTYIYRKREDSNSNIRSNRAFDIFRSTNHLSHVFKAAGLYESEYVNLHKSFIDLFFRHLFYVTPYFSWYKFLKHVRREIKTWDLDRLEKAEPRDSLIETISEIGNASDLKLKFILSIFYLKHFTSIGLVKFLSLLKKILPRVVIKFILKIIYYSIAILDKAQQELKE